MSQSGSRSRAGSPAESWRLAATEAVRSAILTYFGLIVSEPCVQAKGSYRKLCPAALLRRLRKRALMGQRNIPGVDPGRKSNQPHSSILRQIFAGRSLEEETPWINPTIGSTA